MVGDIVTLSLVIGRLNSGVRGVYNFSGQSNFKIENIGNDSVNQAESGDIKILV